MDDYRVRLGRYGEGLAAEFLVRRGYRIVSRNFYTAFGEIDLIAEKGDEFLFCEVKTRTASHCGYPEQAVDFYKTRHLNKAVAIYCQKFGIEKFWRLDVISVEINRERKTAKFRWFKNVGEN